MPFPDLIFFQILFQIFIFKFRTYFRKFVNNLTSKKVRLQNLKLIFPVILRIFDLDYHGQTSLKLKLRLPCLTSFS